MKCILLIFTFCKFIFDLLYFDILRLIQFPLTHQTNAIINIIFVLFFERIKLGILCFIHIVILLFFSIELTLKNCIRFQKDQFHPSYKF